MAAAPSARLVRTFKLAVVVALAATLLPLAPARASHVTARSVDDACKDAPEDGFTDTGPEGSAGEEAVDCISWYGITSGTSATTYSPGRTITRAQMATMIAESMRRSEKDFAEPSTSEDFFDDDDGSVHERNINFVAKHRIVQGIAARRFAPDHNVLRDQMATFIANQLGAIGATVPAPTQDYFSDDETSVHERNINALAGLGIVTGRTHGLYDPRSSVTRGQMAFFITRDLDYLVEKNLMLLPVNEAVAGQHTSVDVVSVDRAGDFFLGNTDTQNHGLERFRYDATDVYRVAGTLSPTTIDMVKFEGLLTGPSGQTPGDIIDVDYQPGANSTFTVQTDNIPLTAPVVVVTNLDGGATINDVVINWTGGQPDATYEVFRDNNQLPPGGNGTAGPEDTELTTDPITATSFSKNNEPDGNHRYIVVATSAGSGEEAEAASPVATVPGTAVSAGSPKSNNAVLETDNGPTEHPVSGDEWRFVFDKPLAAVKAGDFFTMGGTGGPYRIEHGTSSDTNAQFSLNTGSVTIAGLGTFGPGQVLTVQLVRPLGAAAVYPLRAGSPSSLTSTGADPINWDQSFDRFIHNDDSAPKAEHVCRHDPDASEAISDGDIITVVLDEPMDKRSPRPVPEQVVIQNHFGDTVTLVNNGSSATFEYFTETRGTAPLDDEKGILEITVITTPSTALNYADGAKVESAVWVIDVEGHPWNTSPTLSSERDALKIDEPSSGPASGNAYRQCPPSSS